jgi:hypothetical protein
VSEAVPPAEQEDPQKLREQELFDEKLAQLRRRQKADEPEPENFEDALDDDQKSDDDDGMGTNYSKRSSTRSSYGKGPGARARKQERARQNKLKHGGVWSETALDSPGSQPRSR